MASGHVNRIKRPDTWLHRPMLQNVKKVLANPEPSTHGTKRTWCDVRSESAFGGKAEVWLKGRQVRWDPERTSLFLATNILRWARRHKVGRARSLCGLQSNFLTAAIFGYRMVSDCAHAGASYE